MEGSKSYICHARSPATILDKHNILSSRYANVAAVKLNKITLYTQ